MKSCFSAAVAVAAITTTMIAPEGVDAATVSFNYDTQVTGSFLPQTGAFSDPSWFVGSGVNVDALFDTDTGLGTMTVTNVTGAFNSIDITDALVFSSFFILEMPGTNGLALQDGGFTSGGSELEFLFTSQAGNDTHVFAWDIYFDSGFISFGQQSEINLTVEGLTEPSLPSVPLPGTFPMLLLAGASFGLLRISRDRSSVNRLALA